MTRHETDTVSLVAGLLFVAIAGLWALSRAGVLANTGRWLVPLVLIAVGVAGLLTARPRGDRRQS